MLNRITRELPKLTDAVVRAELGNPPSYDVTETGVADTVRRAEARFKRAGRTSSTRTTGAR